MTPALKVFVARLVGLAVLGPDGESIGRVRDVVISMHMPGKQPRALGLAVELTTRRRIFVPMLRVTSIEPDAVTLTTGHVNLRRLRVRPNEALAVGQILDTRVRTDDPDYPELHDVDLTVVDLAIEQNRSRDWMVSRVALRTTRKGLRRRGETIVVQWRHVRGMNRLELSRPGQGVEMALAQFEDMRAPDVANALRELPVKRRDEIAAALDNERLADVLQEMPTDDQTAILGSMEPDRAADVLEAMDPDDVADLMGELPQAEAEAFLSRMDPEDSESVRRLLLHSPDTAGGVMTPEPLIVTANATVSEALARVRDPDVNSAAASMVFVVRPPTNTPTGKFLGAVHTQALLREPPANLVGGILDKEMPRLLPDDSLEKMTRFFATYNLVCAPVIDEADHLLGAVVVDDLLDALLPRDWRETDPEGTAP
ncbi:MULTISPECIES: magnesium transporter MgtE N-terminal domain-containing protein [Gordonia]|uniref:CBS domain-containing protein n=2 Tax=Gordonia TaxID=2053 RepID=L7LJL4_9ACTN|nr:MULTISPECIES: CBS domain-containing protein [Gordonia]AUH69499.1 CBS domain-containing protein [Gordonia sp. YC-JH1]KJR07716.1 magnesium transporter [Gordonia sihwensis]KXT56715.1 magnesium transporter [Gordonia sp. QH-12]MBY4569528.1 magnesium transporter [Gordonia sihwensis]WFN94041.1 CBS domain-containing protein [Gordonia sihwensis]